MWFVIVKMEEIDVCSEIKNELEEVCGCVDDGFEKRIDDEDKCF